MTPWTKKYEPKTSKDILGQDDAVNKLRIAIQRKKPVLLYGPTGVGKTSIIHAMGRESSVEVFEVNSSDVRNKDAIESVVGGSLMQQSLFSRGKLILMDDIDALSGREDRGGLPAVLTLLEKAPYPIIFTCIDPWTDNLSKLRKKCTIIECKPLKKEDIAKGLNDICVKEGIQYTEEDLMTIAKNTRGDLRAAINDLQTHCMRNKLILEEQGERNKQEDIHFCLRKILKGRKWADVQNVFDKTDMDIDECMLWLDENVPAEYTKEDLKRAYHWMSRVDVYKGRIRRNQYWRFLVYMNLLLTAGIAFAKTETNPQSIEYKRTTRILKMWLAKQRYGKRNSVADKLAAQTHMSKKRALKETYPYMKSILQDQRLIAELNLSDEEIEWLHK